jgi:mono/diheme cytochrome c family protein
VWATTAQKEKLMTHRKILTLGSLTALLLVVAWTTPVAAADGQEVFLGQKCNTCHSVETAGIEAKTKSEKLFGGDLSQVTERHETEWIAQYIQREIQKDGADHKREFTGTDEELQSLLDWLKAQATAAGENAGGKV